MDSQGSAAKFATSCDVGPSGLDDRTAMFSWRHVSASTTSDSWVGGMYRVIGLAELVDSDAGLLDAVVVVVAAGI
jgi:hypothetical protein